MKMNRTTAFFSKVSLKFCTFLVAACSLLYSWPMSWRITSRCDFSAENRSLCSLVFRAAYTDSIDHCAQLFLLIVVAGT